MQTRDQEQKWTLDFGFRNSDLGLVLIAILLVREILSVFSNMLAPPSAPIKTPCNAVPLWSKTISQRTTKFRKVFSPRSVFSERFGAS
jgi:hypothetical protein